VRGGTCLSLLAFEGVLGPHALAVQELRLPRLDVPVQVGDQLLLVVAHACTRSAQKLSEDDQTEGWCSVLDESTTPIRLTLLLSAWYTIQTLNVCHPKI